MPQAQAHKLDINAATVVKIFLAVQGRSRTELGAYLNWDSGTMTRALSGNRKWTLRDLDRMAAFFDIPPTRFLENADDLLENGSQFRSRCVLLEDVPAEPVQLEFELVAA